MERLPKWMFRAAICSLLFAIGSLIYVKLDRKQFFKYLPQLPHTQEHPDRIYQVENSQQQTSTQIVNNDNTTDDYDWRTDDTNRSTALGDTTDPWRKWWEQIEGQKSDAKVTEDAESYPPKDWYKTTDPVLHAEYYRAQLIKQFGEVPQVDIFVDGLLKVKLEIPLTLDEKIEHVEAMYDLFPNERTRETIEFLKEWKASGRPFKMEFGPPPKPPDEFIDVKPFVERYGWEEGIAKFRRINPTRAAVFERTVKQSLGSEGAAAFERTVNPHQHTH